MNTSSITDIIYGPALGLTRKEIDAWSWPEFFQLASRGAAQRLGFYRSISDAAFAQRGRPPSDPNSYAIPRDVLERDLTAANTPSLVGSDIPIRRSSALGRSLVGTLPIQKLGGLRESVEIPTSSGASTTWLANEAASTAEGQPSLAQTVLTPKTVACYLELSRALALQAGPAGNAFIIGELELAIGRALDLALLTGSGASGQPQSPFAAAGVGTTSGTSLSWAGVCGLAVSESAQLAPPSWVLGKTAASVLRQRERAAGSGFIFDNGQVAGHPATVSQAAPVSSIYFADWSQILLATFGGLEIAPNPFAGFQNAIVGLRAMLSVDFAAINPGALSKSETVT